MSDPLSDADDLIGGMHLNDDYNVLANVFTTANSRTLAPGAVASQVLLMTLVSVCPSPTVFSLHSHVSCALGRYHYRL